jgi:TATA-binding protein-associated factor
MQDRPEWEVRHGSLLGIKYLVAVRQVLQCPMFYGTQILIKMLRYVIFWKEMLPQLLPRVLPACINGLEDRDDDVRAVAAEAMTPAAAAIVASGENSVNTILLLLWDILLDLDDLSPSTSRYAFNI